MQIRELSKPVTAKQLNESLAQKFGYKLNLEQFSDVQLEDARNKLRTKISQFELEESFDSVSESPDYLKTKIMLDCLNQEIIEREVNEGAKPDFLDLDNDGNKKESMKKAAKDKKKKTESIERNRQIYFSKIRKDATAHKIPESWIESAIKRINVGETDAKELVAELTTRYDLSESQAINVVYLKEGEAEKAATIMATKDMVDQITGWLEDVANLKAEKLLELLDSIRENQGSDVASKYEQAVKPALDQIYSAIEQSRQGLSTALSLISGGEMPNTMGAESPEAGMGAGAGMGAESPDLAAGAPEAGMGAEAGTPEMPGREKRESIDYSRRLGILLAQSKKK
jgi:hypothetical protein